MNMLDCTSLDKDQFANFGWWCESATPEQRCENPPINHMNAGQQEELIADYWAEKQRREGTAPPTGGGGPAVVVRQLTWPRFNHAPEVMHVGTRYAYQFTVESDAQGKSFGIAEYMTPPRDRYVRCSTDPDGNDVVPNAQGEPGCFYGISGDLIFGTNLGQIPLEIGRTYFAVVDMVNTKGELSGPVGTDATAVVALR